MPVQPTQTYVEGLRSVNKQEMDWENDTFNAMLLDDAHTPDVQNHKFVSSLVANEITDPDYARVLIPTRALVPNGANHDFDSGAVSFGTTVTISARYLVAFKQVTNDSDSLVLFIVDLTGGGNANSTSGNFAYDPSASGWAQWQPNQ